VDLVEREGDVADVEIGTAANCGDNGGMAVVRERSAV